MRSGTSLRGPGEFVEGLRAEHDLSKPRVVALAVPVQGGFATLRVPAAEEEQPAADQGRALGGDPGE